MSQPTVKIRSGILHKLRRLHEIGSEEVQARMIGVDRSTLRRIDQGGVPSAEFIAGTCVAFDLPFDALFTIGG